MSLKNKQNMQVLLSPGKNTVCFLLNVTVKTKLENTKL